MTTGVASPTGSAPAPALTLTAVVVMPRGIDELAGALARLDGQTCRDRIEVVLVHTSAHAHEIDAARFRLFGSFQTVALEQVPAVAAAFCAACRVATGQILALVEDHVLLDPGWAAAVLSAHTAPCAAVAPLMANANPRTAVSWANFLSSFHEAIGAATAGPVSCGPGHNTSYKREVLCRYGAELQALYQSERSFHYRLRRDGHAIWYAPEARLAHLNISIPWQALRHSLLGGALFGRYRSRNMSAPERLLRTAGVPLVPLLRLFRILQDVRRASIGGIPRSAWGLLGLLLAGHAAGEALGYWNLTGEIEARYEFFELHRLECLLDEERGLMLRHARDLVAT
jgi:hypothetical protein